MKTQQLFQAMVSYFEQDPMRIQHFIKVYQFAQRIGREEGLSTEEQEILEVAALVHDIGIKPAETLYGKSDGKLQEELGPKEAKEMLEQLGFEKALIERVCYLVGHHHTYQNIQGKDYQILVEADFLVNIYEDQMEEKQIQTVYQRIFQTEAGKKLCKIMYGI